MYLAFIFLQVALKSELRDFKKFEKKEDLYTVFLLLVHLILIQACLEYTVVQVKIKFKN